VKPHPALHSDAGDDALRATIRDTGAPADRRVGFTIESRRVRGADVVRVLLSM
jgi:hypothetical protein